MRCREHFQGDRCKQESGHVANVHVGQFNQWEQGREPERIHEHTREIERDEDIVIVAANMVPTQPTAEG